MKTRYDSVIGLERRALDEKAREVRSVADHIETIEDRIVSIDQSLRAEAAFAVTAIHLPGHAYAARMRNNRSALQEDRRKADTGDRVGSNGPDQLVVHDRDYC